MSDAYHLLVVEDDDDVAFLMRKSLERAGHRVQVCHTMSDALLVLRNQEFQLVLLDQRLPDGSGWDFLQTLQTEKISTPVLMITGYGDEELASQVLRRGALDYISKDRALTFLTDLPKRVHESITRYRLQQSNRLLIEALESARDGVLITDHAGVIRHVNAALEKLFGHPRDELLGKTPRIFQSTNQPADWRQELWSVILAKQSWQGEVVNRRKNGGLVETSLTVSPLLDGQGEVTHFVGIYRDVTERKHFERQLFQAQKMQSVGTLAGGVAHEFNNLLAGIQGYASLGLRESGLTPALQEFLENVVQLSERAANLTRQLLAYARKPSLSRKPTPLLPLLEATASLVKHSLGMEITLDAAGQEDLHAHADANQLQQVLINLCLNARDALPPTAHKRAQARLRHRVLEGAQRAFPQNVPAGDYAVIEIVDQGRGMAPSVLQQAFDPFFTTKEVGQGTGLGLPVAYGIVHGHQGFLTLDSDVDTGTTVGLYLPRLQPPAPLPSHPVPLAPAALVQRSGVILVVDDEQPVLDILRRSLELIGYTVATAANGLSGQEKIEQGLRPDLIILDLLIPKEDGDDNFRRFRDACPDQPIILCTGLQSDLPAALSQAPRVEMLRKPFRMDELWDLAHKLIAAS